MLLPSGLTLLLPDATEICPRTPCLKEVDNLQQLLVFLQQKAAEETARIKELKKYHLQLQQVCKVCVCVSMRVHVHVRYASETFPLLFCFAVTNDRCQVTVHVTCSPLILHAESAEGGSRQ